MDFKVVLVQVISIIAVILLGGFLIFLLGDLMLSILDPDRPRFGKKNKSETNKAVSYTEEVKSLEAAPKKELIENKFEEDVREIDEDKAVAEEVALNEELTGHFERLKQEEEAFRQERLKFASDRNDFMKQLEEKQKAEAAAAEMNKEETAEETVEQSETENEEEKDDDINFDDIFFDDDEDEDEDFNLDDLDFAKFDNETKTEETTETQEVVNEEKTVTEDEEDNETEDEEENETEVVEETKTETTEISEEDKAYIEKLKEEIEVQRKEVERIKEELAKEREEARRIREEAEAEKLRLMNELSITTVEETKPQLTLEEYEERLAVLKERLKVNEKEFKANKKEFLPLRKVKKSLDNDKKKLRRREALVAKQKVVLYGVNNYVDIDEEKAKKLAEDLDLLDGLRLSVQHCEDVMKNNVERYPILERTYEILKTNIGDIKGDIAECENAIEKLKAEDGEQE